MKKIYVVYMYGKIDHDIYAYIEGIENNRTDAFKKVEETLFDRVKSIKKRWDSWGEQGSEMIIEKPTMENLSAYCTVEDETFWIEVEEQEIKI